MIKEKNAKSGMLEFLVFSLWARGGSVGVSEIMSAYALLDFICIIQGK